MHFNIQSIIAEYGYFGVFVILLLEMIGIPFPAETTLTISGFEWTKGVFHLWPLLFAAVLGNIVGSTVAYGIGAVLGRPVVLRLGRYVGLTEARLNAADAKLARYETPLVLVSKFIAGIRVVVPYLAGINRMRFGWFTFLNAVSAIVWAGAFIVAGRAVGAIWTRYHAIMHQFLVPLVIVVIILVGFFIAWKVRRTRRDDTEK